MFTMIPYRPTMMNRYNPFNDEFFRSFFGPSGSAGSFRVDVQDKGDSYLLQAELPGVSKENIHVDLENDVLTISASMDENHEEKNDEGYVIRERRTGNMSRAFNVEGIDREGIQAAYQDGILSLTLPKEKEQVRNAKRSISIT